MNHMIHLLTTAQAAARLALTPRRVRQLADRIGAVRLGDRLLYPAAAVEAFARLPRPAAGYPKGRPRAKTVACSRQSNDERSISKPEPERNTSVSSEYYQRNTSVSCEYYHPEPEPEPEPEPISPKAPLKSEGGF